VAAAPAATTRATIANQASLGLVLRRLIGELISLRVDPEAQDVMDVPRPVSLAWELGGASVGMYLEECRTVRERRQPVVGLTGRLWKDYGTIGPYVRSNQNLSRAPDCCCREKRCPLPE
jgi:hypothetical protein